MATLIDKHGNIAFFGQFSWGNFVDWLVTLCLGLIIMLTTVLLGGVRPDTHVILLPLFFILLALHGVWLAVAKESPKRLSQAPLWFVPGLLWLLCSLLWFSPVPWRGWYEMIYAIEAFIVFWVLTNNVRTRAHLWILIIISLAPIIVGVFNGFYQFFQNPQSMMSAMTEYELTLSPEYLGRATGVFADPDSFAVLLLLLLPSFLIAAAVRRLPSILRILSFYVALMLIAGIVFTQSYWALLVLVLMVAIVPWFCFRSIKSRFLCSTIGVGVAVVVFAGMMVFFPFFQKGVQRMFSEDGEGVRLVLWREALVYAQENPLTGIGAGAYGMAFEQSPRVALADAPLTPHNDYLLLLSQLGLLGFVLVAAPCLYIFYRSWRRWREEPFAVKLRSSEVTMMPSQRFFLSLGLTGVIALGLCLAMSFVFYVPSLVFYAVLAFAILVKTSFNRRLIIPGAVGMRVCYFLVALGLGGGFYMLSLPKLEAQALNLRARQQLEHVVNMQVHVSGNAVLLDEVVEFYEDAVQTDSKHVDAWVGLSSALCQLYFRSPADFEAVAGRAVECAERAVELSPDYWKTWAQLGVAKAFQGDAVAAEAALLHALELAPNSSNANYYYAAFIGVDQQQREQALKYVRRALEINPSNAAARRLQQKLLIL
jgi:O-antigen ligase